MKRKGDNSQPFEETRGVSRIKKSVYFKDGKDLRMFIGSGEWGSV